LTGSTVASSRPANGRATTTSSTACCITATTTCLLADYADYVATQARVDALYLMPDEWQRKAIFNVAGMGPFSADRTISDYAKDTWNLSAHST
jgi:glucan phosphorylase